MAEDPGQIREEIEHTRQELAGTIQALGAKADLKGRVTEAVHDRAQVAKDRIIASDGHGDSDTIIGSRPTPSPRAGGDSRTKVALAVAGFLLLMMMRRRRRRRSS